jgi:glycosyltransferase involved in cell wall biosynthesis
LNTPLLSVIIPVYNVQDLLPTAIDSVLGQGINDLELILVDDGSLDDSLAVCRAYAGRDSRLKVISQKNGGPGAARNAGLKVAEGRFISFVDSDDTVMPGAFRKMLDTVKDGDLVIAHFNILLNNQAIDRGYIKDNKACQQPQFLRLLAKRPGSYYYSALWNKLYRSSLIKENHITFDTSLSWGEDFQFNIHLYRHVKKVSFLKDPVYNYRRTYAGQTWRTMFELNSSFAIKARLFRSLKSLYQACGLYEEYKPYIMRYIFNVTISR